MIWIAAALVIVPLAFIARPGWHLWRTAQHDVDAVEVLPPGFADDASRMNLTAVREVRRLPADRALAENELIDPERPPPSLKDRISNGLSSFMNGIGVGRS